MTIEQAAQQKTVLTAALAYLEAGCSILPVQGKRPATITLHGKRTLFPWTTLQNQQPKPFHVEQWHKKGWLQGIGLIGGAVSGNLVLIDLDGAEAVATFKRQWVDLYDTTYRVVSGSGNGMHVYVYVENMPPSVRAKGFELRGNGCYVVAPPSRHPDTGYLYKAVSGTSIIRRQNLNGLVDWINERNRQEQQRQAPAPAARSGRPAIGRNGYGSRALVDECGKVRNASEGYRNNQLNLSAFRLGQLVAGGYIQRVEAETALYNAAISRGLPHNEAARTIASGLGAGLKNPRYAV